MDHVHVFINNEDGYRQWVDENPNGYIVNVDMPHVPSPSNRYPMVHRTSHKLLSSDAKGNYTTTDFITGFIKACSNHLPALQQWSQGFYNRPLTECDGGNCMKGSSSSATPLE